MVGLSRRRADSVCNLSLYTVVPLHCPVRQGHESPQAVRCSEQATRGGPNSRIRIRCTPRVAPEYRDHNSLGVGGRHWTVESGLYGKEVHAHLAMHVPEDQLVAFEAHARRHLETDDDRALVVKPVRPPLGLDGWLRYMLKALPPKLACEFRVRREDRNHFQGAVLGKRAGVTQDIGATAQSRANQDLVTDAGSPVVLDDDSRTGFRSDTGPQTWQREAV